MNLDLNSIPAIYINLKDDVQKNNSMKSMLSECGFKKIIRIEASKFENRHLAGCSLSHFHALTNIEPPFIIFEDDCLVKNFNAAIEIPDDADAFYLGISSWGRMNSHSGPCVQYENVLKYPNMVRVYNMLGAHSILYLNEEYVNLCSRISNYFHTISDHQDIGFAEIQKYFNVYAFNDPFFYQTSSNGTNEKLSSYPSIELIQYNKNYWKPTGV
jgi:hypothetical protein